MLNKSPLSFPDLGLESCLLQAITEIGFNNPTPIQSETIPYLLKGQDVLGQAQTGTGKTAAFGLPLLQRLKDTAQPKANHTDVLILAPTRELAQQICTELTRYTKHLSKISIISISGGQSYDQQIRSLKRGPNIVVGTPGRIMDHMRKKTLRLSTLQTLVLDEADEMLRMGFIDDVKWILEHAPTKRQMVLFSATMPKQIISIARNYLNNPQEIKIASKQMAVDAIEQQYWLVEKLRKTEALPLFLESQEIDGVIVFTRTRSETVVLSELLRKSGFNSQAINGDLAQTQRQQTIDKLKKGHFDILVATDVAARGLDIERISHVINYDAPFDVETYIHRIGRTGRAGRKGKAISFFYHKDIRLLRQIEKKTNKQLSKIKLPQIKDINAQRIAHFKQQVTDSLNHKDSSFYATLFQELQTEKEISSLQIATSLAVISNKNKPLLLKEKKRIKQDKQETKQYLNTQNKTTKNKKRKRKPSNSANHNFIPQDIGTELFKLAVGKKHGVRPGSIVGAIANEGGLDSKYIGEINIHAHYSTVLLPKDMPKHILRTLQKAWVCNQQLNLAKI